jgi:hypothetical protein
MSDNSFNRFNEAEPFEEDAGKETSISGVSEANGTGVQMSYRRLSYLLGNSWVSSEEPIKQWRLDVSGSSPDSVSFSDLPQESRRRVFLPHEPSASSGPASVRDRTTHDTESGTGSRVERNAGPDLVPNSTGQGMTLPEDEWQTSLGASLMALPVNRYRRLHSIRSCRGTVTITYTTPERDRSPRCLQTSMQQVDLQEHAISGTLPGTTFYVEPQEIDTDPAFPDPSETGSSSTPIKDATSTIDEDDRR